MPNLNIVSLDSERFVSVVEKLLFALLCGNTWWCMFDPGFLCLIVCIVWNI